MTTTVTKADLHGSPPPPSVSVRSATVQANSTPIQKAGKLPGTGAPRIDVEPIYTALKAAIRDDWPLYKLTIAEFALGKRNQSELAWIVDPFLRGDPHREQLHNQLLLAIFANTQREPPDQPGVATWVAANDKPAAATKPVSGDAEERRLKSEIMHLPARERHRLKTLQEDTTDGFSQAMIEDHSVMQIKLPEQQPGSAGGYTNRTNWEPEVRKRYAQPLFLESNEFPDADSIQARMLPLCFEEGCVNGFAPGVPQFMNTAAETYLKEILADVFNSTRQNGSRWTKTGAYKRRFERELDGWHRGEVRKTVSGQLPVEQEAERARLPLSLVDLRLNLDLTGSTLETPSVAMRIFESTGIDDEEGFSTVARDEGRTIGAPNGTMLAPPRPLTNGVLVNGVHRDDKHEDDYGWAGGSEVDRTALDDVLDECLAGLV